MHHLTPRRTERREGGDRVAAEVTDRFIEWAKQELMRGREYNEHAARSKKARGARELAAVVSDVLKNIEVENCVEASSDLDGIDGAANDEAICRALAVGNARFNDGRLGGIWLDADPLSDCARA